MKVGTVTEGPKLFVSLNVELKIDFLSTEVGMKKFWKIKNWSVISLNHMFIMNFFLFL